MSPAAEKNAVNLRTVLVELRGKSIKVITQRIAVCSGSGEGGKSIADRSPVRFIAGLDAKVHNPQATEK